MGGYDAIQSFYRLFLMPGHGHCWEMPAGVPDQFDPITILDQWVETGKAPDSILATSGDGDKGNAGAPVVPAPATRGQSADAMLATRPDPMSLPIFG